MQLQHIAIDCLAVADINMRCGKKPPDLADLLPSIRMRGVLVPLIVRPSGADGQYEIVAGRRRFLAAREVAGEGATGDLPCAIMEAGDDALALEASILENVARAQPHEVEQWVSFTRLVREGRSTEEIALLFGLTERQVGQVLALGNLSPRIRDLYRAGEIDGASVKLLTMATKAQQKEWLALLSDKDRYAPTGQTLKSWLFGGASIPTAHALFDLDAYPGVIVADQSKWKANGARLLAKARSEIERARVAEPSFPSSVARVPASVVLQQQIDAAVRANAVATAYYESAAMRSGHEMMASSVARAISNLQDSPAIRAMRDMIDSPAARAMRELHDSPAMRAMRALQDSPAMRAMREYNESPVAQRAREVVLRNHEAIERARRVSGLF